MERDAAVMGREGWTLAGWRELGAGDDDEGPEMAWAVAARAGYQAAAQGAVAIDTMRALWQLAKLAATLPLRLSRGRERIMAVYERDVA